LFFAERYDVVVIGTGPAASFFLHRYLRGSGADVRVLVLERGGMNSHASQLDGGRPRLVRASREAIANRTPDKVWNYLLTFGGSSNCWVGGTPRMLPNDFRLRSAYGVGEDWPVQYDELERYYCDAEDMMAVSGPMDGSPFPRSRPYPLPPHRFSDVERILKKAYPDRFFVQPTARPTTSTSRRPKCCANHVCTLCPIDSKFTVLNEMRDLYDDPRVSLVLGASAQALDLAGGTVARGVVFEQDGRTRVAQGDLVVLAANALFNPHILLRSGLSHPELGRGLVEQLGNMVVVNLDGVDNFQGSTYVTGNGYMMYDGPHRRERAAALIETYNRPELRAERGKWRQRLRMRVIFEDLRQAENRVGVSAEDPRLPDVVFHGHSDYAQRGLDALGAEMERVLAPLPVEEIIIRPQPERTESHIIGTTPMGADPKRSIVDRHLFHHQLRNVLVLGSSVYPTAAPANPTLTLCALSLRAADHVLASSKAA
jgi:choline dehydrogenase-like flavoprotein